MKTIIPLSLTGVFLVTILGCSAKVGSEQWCDAMKDKAKADWTANEAADFAKHCIFN
ncbi:MAG: DUF3012 domain-containing protein [Candidatus Thiodiazotropha sp.]|nr:DUF3012 domain-containing protein [Candidatus Thiodiazotropha sp.]MCU7804520.1 DUF3012 domain-containing protein [Candidatus Thiodiazotropha sp. (ex Lucinoma borealis)]MCM8883239.1 DUF3012 domain-containing protein [Candidatus Thiodiazotropha sp.]MCM8920960.1 DUF3012 domain-containing protein [Candidatus Thiodiazotropha sp.]MCU7855237.1 DUF3012 domain-containing protein [Candidatus Thiodiazotropha sp. (ex Lucinoma borealis)]